MSNPFAGLPAHVNNVNFNQDGWTETQNPDFRTQWVNCVYDLSGSYAATTRYIYYALILLIIIAHRQSWVVSAAIGTVITYSSTAAIHGLALFISSATVPYNAAQIVLEGVPEDADYAKRDDSTPFLELTPTVFDKDITVVQMVVGMTFYLLLPMWLNSTTFQHSKATQKIIVLLWATLLFSCLLTALLWQIFWDPRVTHPQFRFCSNNDSDALPLQYNVVTSTSQLEAQQLGNPMLWNSVIWDHFCNNNASLDLSYKCLYPCFGSSWPLRDPDEIRVLKGSFPGETRFSTSDRASFQSPRILVSVLLIASTLLSILVIAFDDREHSTLNRERRRKSRAAPIGFTRSSSKVLHYVRYTEFATYLSGSFWKYLSKKIFPSLYYAWADYNKYHWSYSWIRVLLITTGLFLSPLFAVFLVVWFEYWLWKGKGSDESFKHIGQWGVLAGALLAIVSALLLKLLSTNKSEQEEDADLEGPVDHSEHFPLVKVKTGLHIDPELSPLSTEPQTIAHDIQSLLDRLQDCELPSRTPSPLLDNAVVEQRML